MRYYKIVEDGYITSIGTGIGGSEITSEEYDELMTVIRSCPNEEGKEYRLKADLTWESYDVEPAEDEPTAEELLDILTGENE